MTRPFPLPPKPRKPYIQPNKRENKAMTIGLGFHYAGGIILGADQQITRAGWNKFFEPKIFLDENDVRGLALAGANDLALAKEVWDRP